MSRGGHSSCSRVASDPPLSLARIRASRRLLRIGTESLKMTSPEGMALLRAEGVELTPAVGDALVNQAEGWPAGLYFAALALREQPDAEQAAKRFAGDDPLIADYLARGGAAVTAGRPA